MEEDGSKPDTRFVPRLPGVAEIIDEPRLDRACYRKDDGRGTERMRWEERRGTKQCFLATEIPLNFSSAPMF